MVSMFVLPNVKGVDDIFSSFVLYLYYKTADLSGVNLAKMIDMVSSSRYEFLSRSVLNETRS